MAADPLRALARFSLQPYPSAQHAANAALVLLAQHVGVRSAFLSRLDQDHLAIVADYDDAGCGIRQGMIFPLGDAF